MVSVVGCTVQSGGDQQEQRLLRGDLASGEIAELRKLAAALVPGDAGPVIHALQGKVDIFVGFEFDCGETRLVNHRCGEPDDGPAGKISLEGRHLLYSPEIEYFESARSKAMAPSSTTTASRAPLRKSESVWRSESGVIL
jgi:hypothetical protein